MSSDDKSFDGSMQRVLANDYRWKKQTRLVVNVTVPKFDVGSQTKLKSGLEALGITDVFSTDRPFLFVLTGANELPLFVGIVNQP